MGFRGRNLKSKTTCDTHYVAYKYTVQLFIKYKHWLNNFYKFRCQTCLLFID
jgi:hypothetical protein